jgi:universal stress protein E
MLSTQHILVAIADADARPTAALARAAEIAKRTGARVTLFHSLYSPYLAGEQFYSAPELEADIEAAVNGRKKALERLAKPLAAAGIRTHVRCRWDYPVHDSIVREVVREKVDLLVLESHRHRALGRLLLGNTDWQLIRLCPCPVLLVKRARHYHRPRVLVAVDPLHAHAKPAPLDAALLAAGSDFAATFGGKLHALHCYVPMSTVLAGYMVDPMPLPVDVSARYEREVRTAFDRLVASHRLGARRAHLRAGLAVDVLPEAAEELGAQLVVMGAVSRSGLKRLFIGSTAERVIDHLTCDVLVVKPAGFRTPVPRRAANRPVILPQV